jgi:hypothetical protein
VHHLATGRLASGRTGFGWDESGAVGVQQVESRGGGKWCHHGPTLILQGREKGFSVQVLRQVASASGPR